MASRFWRVSGPYGSQQRFYDFQPPERPSGAGFRLPAGVANPLIGSVAGHTIVVTIVALQDFGVLIDAPFTRKTSILNSGTFDPSVSGGFTLEVNGSLTVNGFQFRVIHDDGTAFFPVVAKDFGNGFYPKRGDGIILTYNWDAVSQLVKAKSSYDTSIASAPSATFNPFGAAAVDPFGFSLGHFNAYIAFTRQNDFDVEAPVFGIANVYYSTTKSQWTQQELIDFEEEIKGVMATDSQLPVPVGTTQADWTIFDSRDAAIGGSDGSWTSTNGIYQLRSDQFLDPNKGDNEFQELRNINFPSSGL
jgi:hypothetical protein